MYFHYLCKHPCILSSAIKRIWWWWWKEEKGVFIEAGVSTSEETPYP